MEKNYIGAYPSGHWEYSGTLAEIRATNGPEGALGHPTDSRLELRYRGGQWEALENGAVNLDTFAEAAPGPITAPQVNGQTYDAVTQKTTMPGAVDASTFQTSGEYDFIPVYSAGVPQTAALQIVSGQSQSVAIPAGATAIRLTFRGFGPFAYRLGASNVAAVSTDAPGPVDQTVVVPVTGTHIAVWGIGAGSLVVEAGTYLPKTGFVPVYSSGAPKVASLTIAAGISQRVALPTDCTAFRLTFRDYGPFAYRLGDSNVTAVATDSPGDVLSPVVIPLVPGSTHIAVYGIGAGSLIVEGGLKA